MNHNTTRFCSSTNHQVLPNLPTVRTASSSVNDFCLHNLNPPVYSCGKYALLNHEDEPNPISLLALPAEINLAIFEHMRVRDLHTLRLTNPYFYAMIPPPDSRRPPRH